MEDGVVPRPSFYWEWRVDSVHWLDIVSGKMLEACCDGMARIGSLAGKKPVGGGMSGVDMPAVELPIQCSIRWNALTGFCCDGPAPPNLNQKIP